MATATRHAWLVRPGAQEPPVQAPVPALERQESRTISRVAMRHDILHVVEAPSLQTEPVAEPRSDSDG